MRTRPTLSGTDRAASALDAPTADPTGWLAREGLRPAAGRAFESSAVSRRARRRRPEADRGPGSATVGVSPGTAGTAPCPAEDADPVGYRIGRWARLALTLTVGVAVVVVALALIPPTAAPRMVDVTVGPGDTLWGIATGAAPEQDPRAVVAEIERLNGLTSDTLRVGEVLRVPTSN
jgi:LysM repeat protein